jgi:uncharacterized OB-fold protein
MSEESEREAVIEGLFDDDGLLGGLCGTCDRRHFPLGEHCPWCGSAGPVSARLSTDGTLWSWTSVQAAPPGYDGPVPYGFGVVELPADGLQVVTRLTEADPGRLALGDEMRFTVVEIGAGRTSWAFAPVAS